MAPLMRRSNGVVRDLTAARNGYRISSNGRGAVMGDLHIDGLQAVGQVLVTKPPHEFFGIHKIMVIDGIFTDTALPKSNTLYPPLQPGITIRETYPLYMLIHSSAPNPHFDRKGRPRGHWIRGSNIGVRFRETLRGDRYLLKLWVGKKRVVRHHLPPGVRVKAVTRFNIFLEHAQAYEVLDMKLNFLIHQWTEGRETTFEVSTVEDRIITFMPDMKEYAPDASDGQHNQILVALDPKMKRYQRVEFEPASSEGYWFTTTEYPVDDSGRRTGAGGVNRYNWRLSYNIKGPTVCHGIPRGLRSGLL
ncbi:hypothetical protein HDV00_011497 [Rhizophlyctis rosea]|nr:hypothetical protein HDV00_011497 [Rhizophlyctis rosea]